MAACVPILTGMDRRRRLQILTTVVLAMGVPSASVCAAAIGVLSDGRQAGANGYLSLLGASSAAARTALAADGHSIVAISAINAANLATVDVLWLPLLDPSAVYTDTERSQMITHIAAGKSVVIIAGPDVYNVPDDTVLSAFAMHKLVGNLTGPLMPAIADHAVLSGPYGAVAMVGAEAGYGLLDSAGVGASIFTASNSAMPPATGAVAVFASPDTGLAGSGRVVVVADPFMFGQWLDQPERDHRPFLRNLVAWAAHKPGYTPRGSNISTGGIGGGCAACVSVELRYPAVTATGKTTVNALGAGRCGFGGGIPSPLPAALHDLVGFAFQLDTTATYTGDPVMTIAFDAAQLTTRGITNPASLRLWWLNTNSTVLEPVTIQLDPPAGAITATVAHFGVYLMGALVGGYTDCDANGDPDECQANVQLTVAAAPATGGAVTPAAPVTGAVCTTLAITATSADGYCFSGWTVSPANAAPPVAPASANTTVRQDIDKTVTAQFVRVIEQEPADVTVCEGAPASLTVGVRSQQATGATYQWRRNGADISGAVAATYAITNTTMSDAGEYAVVVTTSCGIFTSRTALLVMRVAPQVVTAPANKNVCIGSPATFTVVVTGSTPLAFQWKKNGQDISGATTASYTITSTVTSDSADYSARITNDCGSITTGPAHLNVDIGPMVTTQPAPVTVCSNTPVVLSIVASGTPPLSYEWRRNGAPITGAVEGTYVIAQPTPADTGTYRAVVTNSCGTALSDTAAVTVKTGPTISVQPTDRAICPGTDLTLTVGASGTAPLLYQWRKGGTPIDGANNPTYTQTGATSAVAGIYDVVVTNECGTLTSNAATISVQIPVAMTSQPAAQAVCAGSAVSFSVTATGSGLLYQWRFRRTGQAFIDLANGPNVSGANSATLSLTGVDATRQGDYSCRVFAACGGPLDSTTVALTVSPGLCDCNGNGIADADDIAQHTSGDCNADGVPDECQLAAGDCNADGIPDACQLAKNDCNHDGIPDDCQIAGADCNNDGVLDACQLVNNDCNGNHIPDDCEPRFLVDAGPDMNVCVGTSAMTVLPVVTGAPTANVTYSWVIVSGPANGASIAGPTLMQPSVLATIAGNYVVEVRVTAVGAAACIATDQIAVTARAMSIDAGPNITICADAISAAMSPVLTGGIGPFTFAWSIDTGSASTLMSQFTGPGPTSPNPTFTPSAIGSYALRLTVTDLGGSTCVASDTLTLQATQLSVTAPPNLAMAVNKVSAPLTLTVSAADPASLVYDWTIDASSPNSDMTQFGGAGSHARTPTFKPNSTGDYRLLATVRNNAVPPCIVMVTVSIISTSMSVDAGVDAAVCTGGGVRLAPAVVGGFGTRLYHWTVEDGGPTTDPHQFTDANAFVEKPLFSPLGRGAYTLRLTVRDAGTPPNEASDTMIVRANGVDVDAGEDLVTQAFKPSRTLGAVPLAAGSGGPYTFQWRVLGGPATQVSQLDNPALEHPRFTPAMTGSYLLEAQATNLADGCVASDTVAIEAITTADSRTVNSEGKLFMALRMPPESSRAMLRVSGAATGGSFSGELVDPASDADLTGLQSDPKLTRRLAISTDQSAGQFIAVIVMFYSPVEFGAAQESALRLNIWTAGQRWQPVATRAAGDVPYPLTVTKADLGRYGFDSKTHGVWAVLDYVGSFAVGIPAPISETPQPESPADAIDSTTRPDQPASDPAPVGTHSSMCGTMGSAGMLMAMTALAARTCGRRRRRLRRRPPRQAFEIGARGGRREREADL